jgi:hypothetical protein
VQVHVISSQGSEAFPVTLADEEVHAFAWFRDSRSIYFATRRVGVGDTVFGVEARGGAQ